MQVNKNHERQILGAIYICVGIFISMLFLKILWKQIVESIFQDDLLMLIPQVARLTKGLSPFGLIAYFLHPNLIFEVVSLRIYVFFLLLLFGPIARDFILAAMLFHFGNSVLLSLLSQELGLGKRISFLSGVMYLLLFAHFDAYAWPMAFQHVISVFFILCGMTFYFKTDQRIDKGQGYRFFFILTYLSGIMASIICRFSTLVFPAMMLVHILLCQRDSAQRLKKYALWWPLFLIYLIYPAISIAYGEARIISMSRFLMAVINRNILLYTIIYKLSVPVKSALLLLLAGLGLFVFRKLLTHPPIGFKKVLKLLVIIATVSLGILLLGLGGAKRLLIPYNMAAPFVGILGTFLWPLQSALSIDSAVFRHAIPLQLNASNFLLSFLLVILFIRNFGVKSKALIILAVWYIGNLGYLYLWNPIYSRHFIYVSPVFCIIFSAVFVYVFMNLMKSVSFNPIAKEALLVVIFLALCIPNVFAIKLAWFRGNMVNTFLTYDYLRAARLIKGDIIRKGQLTQLKRKKLCVDNIMPILFTPSPEYNLRSSDPHNDNARYIFLQTFNNASMDVALNQASARNEDCISYALEGYGINDEKGLNIEPFVQLFEKGIEEMGFKRYPEAMGLLGKALAIRPFLLNYILENLNLNDLEWITSGAGLRTWINRVDSFWRKDVKDEHKKIAHISEIIDKEIDAYIQCLFYMSFLKYVSGDAEGGKRLFSEIRFLENDYGKLYSQLSQLALASSDKRLLDFLDTFDNASLYIKPENYTDRYKFEKFLFRSVGQPTKIW